MIKGVRKKRKTGGVAAQSRIAQVPILCRCGGKPSQPSLLANCSNRWLIHCQIEGCLARNIGQGLSDTVQGWNRLSNHFYR